MILLIYGEDTFRARKTLAATRKRFLTQRDPGGLNLVSLSFVHDSVDKTCQEFFASPFLAGKRLLVLEGFLGATAPEQEKLRLAIERKPESTVAVFFEDSGAESLTRAPLFSLLREQKYSLEHKALSPIQAEGYAMAEIAESGATFAHGAARTLIGAVGVESGRISTECAKLAAYVLGKGRDAVSTNDVHEMTAAEEHEMPIFGVVDALMSGDAKIASIALEKAKRDGVPGPQLLSLLSRQVRLFLIAAEALRTGKDASAVASAAGAHPYAVKKALAAVRKYRVEELMHRQSQLLDVERAFKQGSGDIEVGLLLMAARRA